MGWGEREGSYEGKVIMGSVRISQQAISIKLSQTLWPCMPTVPDASHSIKAILNFVSKKLVGKIWKLKGLKKIINQELLKKQIPPIVVFAIGVTDRANEEELNSIATSPRHITHISSFSASLLQETQETQTYELCTKGMVTIIFNHALKF